MTSTIHLTTGLPASGKTTYARALMTGAGGRLRRVNLDDIRAMLDDDGAGTKVWSHKHEATAQRIQEDAIRAALAGGWDLVVDNTHLTQRMPSRIKQIVAGQARFEVHDFTGIPLEECLRRDAARPRPVGEAAILRLHEKHRSATKGGWRLTAEWLNDNPLAHLKRYEPNLDLPPAVLCDIDGTLALHHERGPYDFEACGTDRLNDSVAHALDAFHRCGMRILLLSGRQEEYREHTERWLAAMYVPYDALWMRPLGDRRSDDVVKAELFDQHVRDSYWVRTVLDDRDRVVALWRRMGLPCWQVNYGDF